MCKIELYYYGQEAKEPIRTIDVNEFSKAMNYIYSYFQIENYEVHFKEDYTIKVWVNMSNQNLLNLADDGLIINVLRKFHQSFFANKNITLPKNSNKDFNIFTDMIHFVGLWDIRYIKYVDKLTMIRKQKEIDEFLKEEKNEYDLFDTDRIKEEYNEKYKDKENDKKDAWWIDYNDYKNARQIYEKNGLPKQIIEINEPSALELMGCYVKNEKTIYICEENIEKTMDLLEVYDEWFGKDETGKYKHFKEFKDLVILHEIGHSIFQYNSDPFSSITNERQANYFSSLMTDGKYDAHIKCLTLFQPFIYRFPLLSLQYTIYLDNGEYNYDQLSDNYYQKVGELYETKS